MAKSQTPTPPTAGEDVEQQELLSVAGGKATLEESLVIFLLIETYS
jgi:hypothetical protein